MIRRYCIEIFDGQGTLHGALYSDLATDSAAKREGTRELNTHSKFAPRGTVLHAVVTVQGSHVASRRRDTAKPTADAWTSEPPFGGALHSHSQTQGKPS